MTNYQYDSYGNVTQKTVNSPDNTYTTYYEYGTDADGTNLYGGYLTREYRILNGSQISSKYVYDYYTGNKKADIDGNGNRINYTYDVLNRLTIITYPDNTTKQYNYNDFYADDKEIWYKDQNNNWVLRKYNIFGNQVNYWCNIDNGWYVLNNTEYDSSGNKSKDINANNNSTRYEYDSNNRLIRKSYWENDSVQKSLISLSYNINYDALTPLMLAITDEEGYVKKYYYDISDKLSKLMVTPDNINYYSTTYGYNYVSNLASKTDNKNNITRYVYDDLGRLIKQTDAQNNNSLFTYNSLNLSLTKEEPGNKMISYQYDALGQMILEKVYNNGETDYRYRKYDLYDNNGNIKLIKIGSVVAGVDGQTSETSYVYNAINKNTDEYNKIDSTRTTHKQYSYDNNGNRATEKIYYNTQENKYIKNEYTYDFLGNIVNEQRSVIEGDGTCSSYYANNFAYDTANNLRQKLECLGKDTGGNYVFLVINYNYDYRNSIISKIEPMGIANNISKTTTYAYDKKGNMLNQSVIKQGIQCTYSYEYDGIGNKIRETDALGNTTRYVYDANSNMIKTIDGRYYTVVGENANPSILNTLPRKEYEYDAMNRIFRASVKDSSSSNVISYLEYDGRGNITKKVDGEGYNSTTPANSIGETFIYDASNNVVKYISAATNKVNKDNNQNNITKTNNYDGSNKLIMEKDAYGSTTTYSYYMNGLLKDKTYPDSIKESYDYDLTGKLELIKKNRAGNTTKFYNNILGKTIKVEYPDATTEAFEYDALGELTKATDKSGNIKTYQYDYDKNLIAEDSRYKEDGSNYYNRVSRYTYDENKNLLSKESFVYSINKSNGSKTSETSTGNRSVLTYDKDNRLIDQVGPNNREEQTSYDAIGNIVCNKEKVSDTYSNVSRYDYDLLGNLVSKALLVEKTDIATDKLSGAVYDNEYPNRIKSMESYTYYTNGKLKTKKDANGNITSYQYDNDGRITKITDPKLYVTSYVYDFNNNMLQKTNAKANTTYYDYDSLNNLIRKKDPSSDGGQAITRYTYDLMGNKTKEITPNNYNNAKDTQLLVNTMSGLSCSYDSMNRLVSIQDPEGNLIKKFKYDAIGNVKKIVDGLNYIGDIDSSAGMVYDYDSANKVVKTTDALGNINSYEYDALDNLVKHTDARSNQTVYEYYSDKTLKRITYPDTGVVEYTYDKLGNKLTQKDQLGNVTTYLYNAFGKIGSVQDANGGVVENRYDQNGNVVQQKDGNGSYTYYSYDSNDKLLQKKIPLELDVNSNVLYGVENYTYDELRNITRKETTGTKNASDSRIVNISYYPNNKVNTITDNNGGSVKNYYDKDDNLIKSEILRDVNQYEITKKQYDNQDRMIASIQLVDEGDIYNASSLPNIANLRDSEYSGKIQLITGTSYDILGNKIKVTEPMAYGYLDSDVSNRGNYTSVISYDKLNRENKVTRKYNGTDVYIQHTYDSEGNKTKERDARGKETQYEYDNMNRIVTVTDPMNNVTKRAYDFAGNILVETDANKNTKTMGYDNLNRLVMTKDAYGNFTDRKVYDKNGNVIKDIDAKGYLSGNDDNSRYGTTYSYDLANRLVKVVDPEKTGNQYTNKYEYNQFGEKTKNINGLGYTTQYDYDSYGKLIKVTDDYNVSTQYAYDTYGNMKSMADGRGLVKTTTYGALGIIRSTTDPDNRSTSYKYDLALKKVSVIDKSGNETKYSYDNMDNLLERKVVQTGDVLDYSYDVSGNRIGMTDGSGTSTYAYNDNNMLLSISKGGTAVLSYIYDANANILTVTDKKGNTTTYGYDNNNRLSNVSYNVAGVNKRVSYVYDENGNRKSIKYDGGVSENYTFDKRNRLLTLTNKKPDGGELSIYTYSYDLAGNQQSKTDNYGTTTYTYDKDGRISKVEAPGKTSIFTYDNSSNRLGMNETYTSQQICSFKADIKTVQIQYMIKKIDYTYTNSNQLINIVEKMYDNSSNEQGQRVTDDQYDKNGNLYNENVSYIKLEADNVTEKISITVQSTDVGVTTGDTYDTIDENTKNTYDGFNRLTKSDITKEGARTLVAFVYDGDDLRENKTVKRSINNFTPEITNYQYDDQNVILETDGSDNISARYIMGINYIARIDGLNKHSNFLFNGHGDVIQTVNDAGMLENQYDYDIFGNASLTIEGYSCAIRYTGEFYDVETGLYYLRARYYDPEAGRFISEDTYTGDPNDPLSLNLYTYCHNEPIMYWDPSGNREIVSDDDGKMITYDTHTGNVNSSNGTTLENISISQNKDKTVTTAIVTDGATGNKKVIVEINADTNIKYNNDRNLYYLGVGENSNVNINNSKNGSINTLDTGKQSNVVVDNSGKIKTVNTGDDSTAGIINRGNGTINTVNTGTGSISVISNYGNASIDTINTGIQSKTTINNNGNGFIDVVKTGTESTSKINNNSTIVAINTGRQSDNTIINHGNIYSLNLGYNSTTVVNSLLNIDYINKRHNKIIIDGGLDNKGIRETKNNDWVNQPMTLDDINNAIMMMPVGMVEVGVVKGAELAGKGLKVAGGALKDLELLENAGKLLGDAKNAIGDGLSKIKSILPGGAAKAGDNFVYISKNADDVVQYVGITNNIARRAAEHLASKGIQIEKLMGGLSRSDARAVEQTLIEINGLGKNGGTLINKINSIAKGNPKYSDALERGYELLKSIGYK